MATPYNDIYELFAFKIKAYELSMLLPDEREEILFIYLKSVVAKFYKICKTDISENQMNNTLFQFEPDLTLDEKDIIAESMIVEWLKPQLYSDELLESRLNTKDFSEYSPSKLIDSIRTVFEESKKESKRLIIRYSYSHGDISQINK